jgi:hypothetical protein
MRAKQCRNMWIAWLIMGLLKAANQQKAAARERVNVAPQPTGRLGRVL